MSKEHSRPTELIDSSQGDYEYEAVELMRKFKNGIEINNDEAIMVIDGLISALEHQQSETKNLREQLVKDELTGLYNRRVIKTVIMPRLEGMPEEDHFLIRLDLNNFKQVNDSYGHEHGDMVLEKFAEILVDSVRGENEHGDTESMGIDDFMEESRSDVIARVGGDEFIIFGAGDNQSIERIKERVNGRLFEIADYVGMPEKMIGVAFGGAMVEGIAFDQAMRQADHKCYADKFDAKANVVDIEEYSIARHRK